VRSQAILMRLHALRALTAFTATLTLLICLANGS
jgi:hypothetical protein